MASVEQLPSGRWRPVARDSSGKKIPRLGTYAGKREAQRAANKAEVDAQRRAPGGKSKIPASVTWGAWWDMLTEDRALLSDTERTEAYAAEKHIRPVWGETALNEIAKPEIQRWINGWQLKRKLNGRPYSANYVRNIYGVFAMSINKALDEEILDVSPLRKIKLPKRKKRIAKRYISDEDEPKILRNLNVHNARAVEFARLTGTRPGELAGLHPDQVDRKRMKLIIRTVYVTGRKMMRDWPKDGDEREVPLTTRALELINKAVEGRDMSRPCGVPHFDRDCPGDVIFRTQNGKVIDPDNLRKAMVRAASSGGENVPVRSPYDGRRGYSTRLREAGVHPFTMMELLGHETMEETHGYSQQGDDVPRSIRAVLGDPAVSGLSLVGRPEPHGTDRGTDPSRTVADDVGTSNERQAR